LPCAAHWHHMPLSTASLMMAHRGRIYVKYKDSDLVTRGWPNYEFHRTFDPAEFPDEITTPLVKYDHAITYQHGILVREVRGSLTMNVEVEKLDHRRCKITCRNIAGDAVFDKMYDLDGHIFARQVCQDLQAKLVWANKATRQQDLKLLLGSKLLYGQSIVARGPTKLKLKRRLRQNSSMHCMQLHL